MREELNRIENINKIVCVYYNLPEELYQSKTRKREFAQARQIAMYFSKIYTKASPSKIGELIGARDHATVLHAVSHISNLYDIDKFIREDIDIIDKSIRAEFNLEIEERSRVTKAEIREAVMMGVIFVLDRRLKRQAMRTNIASKDILMTCDRLTTGNLPHQIASIKSIAINLKL